MHPSATSLTSLAIKAKELKFGRHIPHKDGSKVTVQFFLYFA